MEDKLKLIYEKKKKENKVKKINIKKDIISDIPKYKSQKVKFNLNNKIKYRNEK